MCILKCDHAYICIDIIIMCTPIYHSYFTRYDIINNSVKQSSRSVQVCRKLTDKSMTSMTSQWINESMNILFIWVQPYYKYRPAYTCLWSTIILYYRHQCNKVNNIIRTCQDRAKTNIWKNYMYIKAYLDQCSTFVEHVNIYFNINLMQLEFLNVSE